MAARLARSYGRKAREILRDARQASDLGRNFGGELSAREVDWLVSEKRTKTAEDILWRHRKLGPHLTPCATHALTEYLVG